MRRSITQEFDYGCGIACYAFALNISYKQAERLLGAKQSKSTRFWVKDLSQRLNESGLNYSSRYLNKKIKKQIYIDGTIVLIRRSKKYIAGHYLIRYKGYWMDPWINLPFDNNIANAKSGFRKRLPGSPMYAILPEK
ncbi:hypothetical protein H6794_00710 [Candidatus Nomurabacteria bacterium]|nr:hypothetical protein [Candidatus Saccharibacteria bacterium]MCB9839361.1 hypothetical protein [Candidatus Nomurabacteria bacterium]